VAADRYVYSFEAANPTEVDLLGGKGAGLAAMTARTLPVPPGFIITTAAARFYLALGSIPSDVFREVDASVAELERLTGRTFGGGPLPLLVSVRSGAPVSMPGMMDTVLNLGMNEAAAAALASAAENSAFMADVYVRFHRMYAEIVLGADGHDLAAAAQQILDAADIDSDPRRLFVQLREALTELEMEQVGVCVPDDPREQLEGAVRAVFDSWNSRRAKTYRRLQGIPDSLGTAVVVQTMVFGNLGATSGSGVVFSRDPATGEPRLYGEFLPGGQGEAVVSGEVTPIPIAEASVLLPEVFSELGDLARSLEIQERDVVDIEFTVEMGRLYLLQVRAAKRTAAAAIRIVADFLREGRVSQSEALGLLTVDQFRVVGKPSFESIALEGARGAGDVLGVGIGASPGQVSGIVILDSERAEGLAASGDQVLLARPTTSPLDLHGMIASVGIITSMGGATSHAAVVARALGKACVVGCRDLSIDEERREFSINGRRFPEGTVLSIDGSTGEIIVGRIPVSRVTVADPDRQEISAVAREASRCRIYGVATTDKQVDAVLEAGAEGVALRLGQLLATTGQLEELLQCLLAARDTDAIDLSSFEPMMTETLSPLLEAAGGADVTVRALDLMEDDAVELLDPVNLLARHPRLALPLGVPELLRVQIAALAHAAAESGYAKIPELVVRRLSDAREVRALSQMVHAEVSGPDRRHVRVGVFVTTTRAALMLPELAEVADSLWFDARRLQAGSFGYHSSAFLTPEPLDDYVRRGMLPLDPRTELDPAQLQLLACTTLVRVKSPSCRLAVRLPTPVSEAITAAYYRAGMRVFAVDADEVAAVELALGKSALSDLTAPQRSLR
jgi:pyruvate,orthophosphate dikinase